MKPIFLIISFAWFGSFPLQAQIIYVDSRNTTGTEDGTSDHPFNTIREGLAAAVPGTTVFIREGRYDPDQTWSYYGHAVLMKAGVKLVGEGIDKTIVDGNIVDIEQSDLPISVEKIRLKEFFFGRGAHNGPPPERNIIRNCYADIIKISHGAGYLLPEYTLGPIYPFTIENNETGPDGGIEFWQGAGAAENIVQNNNVGFISLSSGAGYTYQVVNNDVRLGIEDKSGGCYTTISNNRITDGPIVDRSGRISEVEDQFIENNTIHCTDQSPWLADESAKAGIHASAGSVTIRNNLITCTGKVSGIYSTSGGPFNVIGNTIIIDEVLEIPADPDHATSGLLNSSGIGVVTGNSISGGYIGYNSRAGTIDFSGNMIRKSYTGFMSSGMETVHHNTIEGCHGHGMILNGLKGPLHHNIIRDNGGSGIRVIRTNIDLGGGANGCPGLNVVQGNGNFDLYIEPGSNTETIFARHNIWDHTDPDEILHLDIHDARDPDGRPNIDFFPLGTSGISTNDMGSSVRIYPNPVTGKVLTVECDQRMDQIQVFSLSGQILNSSQLNGGHYCRIDISGLDAGYLIVAIRESNGYQRFFKIVRLTDNR